ncbi:MAG TPA: glycogen synthase [Bacilli bacterium]|nr:glycogen synthase [Bacilli bacterium]
MKILMVTSEANPYAKTGGLADVVYALAKELTIHGEEASIVMPYYQSIVKRVNGNVKLIGSFDVFMSWRKQTADLYRTYVDGITYYFIGNAYYFNRENIYGYYDDIERFAFFTLAARNMLKFLKLKPRIIHIHDWQAGMLPALIKEQNGDDPFYDNIRFVTTIHNPAFQGLFDPFLLSDFYGLSDELFRSGKVRFKGAVSSLKTSIMYSDKITTVSPTHAGELLTEEGGHGLNHVLQYVLDDFKGILNGIDYEEWNPQTDGKIFSKYGYSDYKVGKRENKVKLLQSFNMSKTDGPVFGLVSRLTWQKGVELITNAAPHIIARGGSIIVLGSGEYGAEQDFNNLIQRFPGKVGVYIGYNDELAHRIYAASDFFLMPSLFEPCGISQMISLRYGTLPLVRITGGLRDTVFPFTGSNLDTANGYGFYDYTTAALIDTVSWAIDNYHKADIHGQLIYNAFKSENDWAKSAQAYLDLYESIE